MLQSSKDFRRNIPCFKSMTKIHLLANGYDDRVWDDEEYWKWRNDLIGLEKISLSDGCAKGHRDWNQYH